MENCLKPALLFSPIPKLNSSPSQEATLSQVNVPFSSRLLLALLRGPIEKVPSLPQYFFQWVPPSGETFSPKKPKKPQAKSTHCLTQQQRCSPTAAEQRPLCCVGVPLLEFLPQRACNLFVFPAAIIELSILCSFGPEAKRSESCFIHLIIDYFP